MWLRNRPLTYFSSDRRAKSELQSATVIARRLDRVIS